MKYTKPWTAVLAVCVTALVACKKDPPSQPPPPPVEVFDLSQARLTDFQLEEVTYSNIGITHPVVTNGVETAQGEIRVTIPQGATQLQLTPKATNFTNSNFTVTPQLGTKQNFQSRVVIYTIASKKEPSKQVHYAVTITEEQPQQGGQAALTSFRFEKAKNAFLPADIIASKIVEGNGTLGEVFIFVPAGTSFASLTATIGFQGTGLFYSQDAAGVPANSTTAYPANGMAVDFTYPKVFYAVVKNGGTVKTYNVIVDIRTPVVFDNPAVTTSGVAAGNNHYVETTTFRNQGNHPISLVSVAQSDALPAGSTALRGSGVVPTGGVKPGERAKVYTTINAQTYPAGTYQVTSTFKPRIFNYPAADDLLNATALRISSTIIP